VLRDFLILLQPFAPHLAEELFHKLAKTQSAADTAAELGPWTPHSLAYQPWPKYDPNLLVESTLEIPVQVNGKLRDLIVVPFDATSEQTGSAAMASEKVKTFTDGKIIKKTIVLPGRLVNIVVAG
jgi:leucyl-tRNA synthetase